MPTADPPKDAVAPPGGTAARRSRPIYRVFVSSTWLDLQPERKALMEALNRMEEMRFVGMEFFGNRPDDTHDASIDQVDVCEVFVGIIGFRYGSGITEAEYRRARAIGLPCFVYFKRDAVPAPELTDNDPALAAKLAAFKQELLRGHTVKEVDSPQELAASATADLHNWVAARWISLEQEAAAVARPRSALPDADRTNGLRLIERIEQDWIKGVLEASLHHRAWLDLGLDWREDAVEHPWDRIVVAPNRPIQTLSKEDSICSVFDAARHTLLVLGEPGAGKTTTALELARDLIARARESAAEPVPVVLALSTWRGQHKDLLDWLVTELGLRYQVPKRVARTWLEDGRLVLILDGLDEVVPERRAACVDAINAFEQAHPPPGLAVTCRVAEYEALTTKLQLRSAICLQPLTPVQIDRYFKAAGSGLDPLRQALQDDAGLRELARSPLMLSVMTMAWRDAPAGTTTPFAATQAPEELRRRLFDTYVKAALNRRGKTTGQYTPEQTMGWLTWLARRMKENGYTLFALEQLQPGWLDGAWRQFGYFLGSRLLGTLGLTLPWLFFLGDPGARKQVLVVSVLGLLVGGYLGLIDFAFARHNWGGHRSVGWRLGLTLAGLISLLGGWMGLSPEQVWGAGVLYLVMVGVAFCAPVDVRALDIKPAGSIQWSGRQAEATALTGLVAMLVLVAVGRLITLLFAVGEFGWRQGWFMLGGWPFLTGLALGGGLAVAPWSWVRPAGREKSRWLSFTYMMIGGQACVLLGGMIDGLRGSISHGVREGLMWNAGGFFVAWVPMLFFYVFGGFGSTLIDPARPQQAGFRFWLRVPVLAFLTVGGVIFVPGLALMTLIVFGISHSDAIVASAGLALCSAGCGLVAFLRFGGFNGAQHFLLRWLLVRGGHLPSRPEAFLRHAAQLALLQKVGLGYRFIHALLLQHLAGPAGGTAEPVASEISTGGSARPAAGPGWRVGRVLRVAAGLGLGAGLLLFVWLGVAGLALIPVGGAMKAEDVLPSFLVTPLLAIGLVIPPLLLTGRWLALRSWRWLAAGWLGLGLTMAYLVQDEPAAPRPPGLAGAPTAFPGADKSDAVFGRYSVQPRGQPSAFKWTGSNFSQSPEQVKNWRNLVVSRRTEIESNWQKLEPVRNWVAELNVFERIADPPRDWADFRAIDPQVQRTLVFNSRGRASLQAIDGQGEAALATLLPLLEVGGKLEEAARRVQYFKDAREMQDVAIKTAGFVLDHTRVSAEVRARFAAALVARGGGAAGARRLYAIRYARLELVAQSYGRVMPTGAGGDFAFLKPELDLLGRVVFNRQASLNRWGELFADLAEFAARRQPDQAQQRATAFLAQEKRVRFKDVGSAWVACLVGEPLGLKETAREQKEYWLVEDRRMALHARLLAP